MITISDLLLDIVNRDSSATFAVSARVDACEIILAHGYEGKPRAVEFLLDVARGQNPNADLTTRVRAIRALIANKIEVVE